MATDIDLDRVDRFLSDPKIPKADKDALVAQLRARRVRPPGQALSPGEVRAQTRGTSPFRPAVQAAGGFGGALLGGPGGALAGASLADLPFQVAEGEVDPKRLGLQAAGTAALQATPLGRELSLGKRVLGSGLVTAMAGQAYDLMHDWWTGKPRGGKAAAGQMAQDLLGGAVGQGIAETQGPGASAQSLAERRARFARAGITPKASELAPERAQPTLRRLENLPEGLLFGGSGPARFAERRAGEARGAVEGVVGEVSPTTHVRSAEEGGYLLTNAIEEGHDAAQQAWDQAFRATEAVTGDRPVVPVTHLLPALQRELRVGEQLPAGPPGYAGRLARNIKGRLPKPAVTTTRETGLFDAYNRPATETETTEPLAGVATALTQQFGIDPADAARFAEAASEGQMPFWLARRLESQLGRTGFRGRPPVGATRQQAQAGRLYHALLADLDAFYETTEGQQVHPQLQQAKELYRHGLALFNESKARSFLSGKKPPERAFAEAFTPGNVTATREVQEAVPPAVWDRAAQGWLAGLYQKHVREIGNREDFNWQGFARDVQKYAVPTGGPEGETHLSVILGPERAAQLTDLVGTFNQMRQPTSIVSRSSGTAERGGSQVQAGLLGYLLTNILRGDAGAVTAGAVDLGMGPALGALTTRPGGIRAMTEAAQAVLGGRPLGGFSPPVRAGLTQIPGQAALPAVNYDLETIRRALGDR